MLGLYRHYIGIMYRLSKVYVWEHVGFPEPPKLRALYASAHVVPETCTCKLQFFRPLHGPSVVTGEGFLWLTLHGYGENPARTEVAAVASGFGKPGAHPCFDLAPMSAGSANLNLENPNSAPKAHVPA